MTAPDMAASIVPRSDQINADDLITGPATVTITEVKRGAAEQPVDIITAEYGTGRAYRPSKTMRRIIIAAWGTNSADYIGRRMTIYRDPEVTFGRDKVGGIKISHLSHIEKQLSIALTVTRGRRAPFTVEVLPDTPPAIAEFESQIAAATTFADLNAIAKALKATDLGEHHAHLLSAWSARRDTIPQEQA
jgi:hypothetical protein